MLPLEVLEGMVDDAIVSPNVLEMETKGYGTVIAFITGSQDKSGPTISPLGNVIMTQKEAQNYAVTGRKLIRKGKSV